MSRSDYSDNYDQQEAAMWRGRVASATRGRRGQQFFRDLLAALDAMPVKRLIADDLERLGEFCAIGSLCKARGIDVRGLDSENTAQVASLVNIADCLAREVVYMNDEGHYSAETPEHRYVRMRQWVVEQIMDVQP